MPEHLCRHPFLEKLRETNCQIMEKGDRSGEDAEKMWEGEERVDGGIEL